VGVIGVSQLKKLGLKKSVMWNSEIWEHFFGGTLFPIAEEMLVTLKQAALINKSPP
jgi:hypothetical protein